MRGSGLTTGSRSRPAVAVAVVVNILTASHRLANSGRVGSVEMATTDGAAKLSTVERVVKSEYT